LSGATSPLPGSGSLPSLAPAAEPDTV
jgi:hypothetical protein